jgi:thiol:disulfide interchange protein DsbA
VLFAGPPSRAWIGQVQGGTYNSFGVATQLRKAVQMQDAYKVEGTPALGMAGASTDGSMAGGFERMVKLANQLIEQVRKSA